MKADAIKRIENAVGKELVVHLSAERLADRLVEWCQHCALFSVRQLVLGMEIDARPYELYLVQRCDTCEWRKNDDEGM